MLLLLSLFHTLLGHKLLTHLTYQAIGLKQIKLPVPNTDSNLLFRFEISDVESPMSFVSYSPLDEQDIEILDQYPYIQANQVIYCDYESIVSRSGVQLIEIPVIVGSKQVYFGTFSKNTNQPHSVTIDIYQKDSSICINYCQGDIIETIRSRGYCEGHCTCHREYFGEYCQFERRRLQKNIIEKIELLSKTWVYLALQAEENSELEIYSEYENTIISYGYGGVKGFEVPGFNQNAGPLSKTTNLNLQMGNLHLLNPKGQILYIGLWSETTRTITLELKVNTQIGFWRGNFFFLIFTAINLVIMLICYLLSYICKQEQPVKEQRRQRVRPVLLSINNPKSFTGSFFDKHFESLDYTSLTQQYRLFADMSTCTICLDNLDTKPVAVTPCYHVFHHICLKKWFMKQLICPHCRFQMKYETIISDGWLAELDCHNQNAAAITIEQHSCSEFGEPQQSAHLRCHSINDMSNVNDNDNDNDN